MNSKYRIGFLCAGAAFFLFITLAYKMTYDYTMDKYMEKVSERNEDVQKADGIGKTESIAAEGEAVKGGALQDWQQPWLQRKREQRVS